MANTVIHNEESFISYQSQIKYNDGLFKSLKQSNYILKNQMENRNNDNLEKQFGFTIDESTQFVTSINGTMSFADYGSRSKIPFLVFYVFDKYGIVKKYRVGGNGNLRDGWGPDPKKCKLQWERPADLQLPQWEEPKVEEKDPATFVPISEKRQKVCGEILSIKHSYNDWGPVTKIRIADDRGFVLYGSVPSALEDGVEKGDRIQFMCKIQPSVDDDQFGYYSRPTKAIKLEET